VGILTHTTKEINLHLYQFGEEPKHFIPNTGYALLVDITEIRHSGPDASLLIIPTRINIKGSFRRDGRFG
jgi:hypothetical protein